MWHHPKSKIERQNMNVKDGVEKGIKKMGKGM